MAKEDKQTLDNLTELMNEVELGLPPERFVNTKADLLAIDTTDMSVWKSYFVRTDSDYDNAMTKYNYDPEGKSPTANGFVFRCKLTKQYMKITVSMQGDKKVLAYSKFNALIMNLVLKRIRITRVLYFSRIEEPFFKGYEKEDVGYVEIEYEKINRETE